jgi:hypothetical protein
MPIRHQSDRSDISSDRGRTSPGSCPSTKEAPSNQDRLHRIQVILKNQEVFGRTLTGKVHALIRDRHRSREFIESSSLSTPLSDPNRLDNHSAHISKETKAWLADQPAGRFEFSFTPMIRTLETMY